MPGCGSLCANYCSRIRNYEPGFRQRKTAFRSGRLCEDRRRGAPKASGHYDGRNGRSAHEGNNTEEDTELDSCGTGSGDDSRGVNGDDVGQQHEPVAFAAVGPSLRSDQRSAMGADSFFDSKDRSLCRLWSGEPVFLPWLEKIAHCGYGRYSCPVAASRGSGRFLDVYHCKRR